MSINSISSKLTQLGLDVFLLFLVSITLSLSYSKFLSSSFALSFFFTLIWKTLTLEGAFAKSPETGCLMRMASVIRVRPVCGTHS